MTRAGGSSLSCAIRRAIWLLARNRGCLRDKIAPANASGEGPARVYLISARPMTEEEWERAFVRPG